MKKTSYEINFTYVIDKMKKSKMFLYAAGAVVGAILAILSRTVFIDNNLASGFCIGLGSVCLVLGVGNLVAGFVLSKSETPEMIKAREVEENDERSIRVREKSGWMTARVMAAVLCVFALGTAFMGLELYITLIFSGLVVLEAGLLLGFNIYFEKRT